MYGLILAKVREFVICEPLPGNPNSINNNPDKIQIISVLKLPKCLIIHTIVGDIQQ